MIELENVSYGYGSAPVFADVSFTLAPGSFHFLTGPSGAGKTTLLRLCYGALVAGRGTVRLFGDDVASLSRDALAGCRQRIGVVHQDQRFLDHLSLADNVALPLTVAGRTVDPGDLAELLAWVGLDARRNHRPAALSGGERQRAALARAVLMGPEVILADEPTGNIDWEMSRHVLELMIELNRMGITLVIATHDLALIRAAKLRAQARVLRLVAGSVQAAGVDL